MGRVAKETNKLLATGHQRHYSILYDNAVHTIGKAKLLGDLHSIRAQWHRGNLPGNDSWKPAMPGDASLVSKLEGWKKDLEKAKPSDIDALQKKIAQLTAQLLDAAIDPAKFGYTQITLPDGSTRTPLEDLIRWRLWNRTGGGLMAELGSHQLDAAGIFVSAMRGDGTKVRPLSVTAVGGRQIFPADREIDDHVYCMFEYPAPGYEEDKNKKIVVTYSSINGNGFGDYGEVVMGTKGTLVLEREQAVCLGSRKGLRGVLRLIPGASAAEEKHPKRESSNVFFVFLLARARRNSFFKTRYRRGGTFDGSTSRTCATARIKMPSDSGATWLESGCVS